MYKILANTVFLGKDIIHLTECHSTSDEAIRRLKAKEIAEGSIIITDNQTKGRGQRGNSWEVEPSKNLTFSIILRPNFLMPAEQFWLNMVVSLAIWETLSSYLSGIWIKWPNDLVHDQSGKIGGVLIENSIQNASIENSVVGIGLNINQRNFSLTRVCSMATLAGQEFDKWEILKSLVKNLERYYLLLKKGGRKQIKADYLQRLYRLDTWAGYDDGKEFDGKILGIEEDGRLRIEKDDGLVQTYAFKEIRFL
jgi:BirA family biotin operon repressor/biotin-[acetyl-CoA-carboxylase] ligase